MSMEPEDDTAARDAAGPAVTPGSEPAPGLPDDMLIILPVRNLVLFPGVILPVAIKREKTVARRAGGRARRRQGRASCCRRIPRPSDPGFDDLHRIGTVASIVRYVTAPDGTHHLVVPGRAALPRARCRRRLSVPGGARRVPERHRRRAPGGRGAHAAAEAEGGRGDHAAAAGAGRARELDPGDRVAGGARRHDRELPRRRSRPRSRSCSRSPTSASGSTASRRC